MKGSQYFGSPSYSEAKKHEGTFHLPLNPSHEHIREGGGTFYLPLNAYHEKMSTIQNKKFLAVKR